MMINTILHYSLGFNSDRGGGLTKYAEDLMHSQSTQYNVVLLFPGEYRIASKKTRIKKENIRDGIDNYSIINPLSIPFLCGIKDERYLTHISDVNVWKSFFKQIRPDIFHIHTLIGLNRECIEAAKELGIPIVYTTHDYFGLCAKQTFVYKGEVCEERLSCKLCAKCNSTGISNKKLFILHSKLFCKMRKFNFIKRLKNNFKEKNDTQNDRLEESGLNFLELKKKYDEIFRCIDFFHFNSTVAQDIFKDTLKINLPGKVVSITHKGIKDNRLKKGFCDDNIHLLYLGPPQIHKGFQFLFDVLDRIYLDTQNFDLSIYCYSSIDRPYIKKCGDGYKYSDLNVIFDRSDLLIVPSQWYETFGFIAAEAMSFGVPVMVSSNVGCKDIINNGVDGIIVDNESMFDELSRIINNKEILVQFNEEICRRDFYSFEEHSKDMMEAYKLALNVGGIK